MTKIKEQAFLEDGKLHVLETHDFDPVLERAKALKSAGRTDLGESKLVGLVPLHMWTMWARKWGVNPQDNAAMREVVARELANLDNSHLRVWDGRF